VARDRKPVLLTVSGTIPGDLSEQVAAGRRPRADYSVIADVTGAEIVDVDRALRESGAGGRLVHRVAGTGALLAWFAFRRRRCYDVVLSDGEQVGILLALLTRLFGRGGCAHVMIVHILSVPKKERLIRSARLSGCIDRFLTYCTAQTAFVRDRLGVEPARIVQSPFMVDTEFFDRDRLAVPRTRMICSAGLERRDYPTLMAAVEGLDVKVVIAAASPWSKQADSSAGRTLPDNVEVRKLDHFQLRRLYAESAFVVMPLVDVDFQAGITTILEAMSMGLAVVCTRTSGQTDTVIDGHNGVYVRPSDPAALRAAIVRLLADQGEADRLGTNGREWVVAQADVSVYAQRIGTVVDEVRGVQLNRRV
jgi:glycosyltransferase involved in cell wall biosynthesis